MRLTFPSYDKRLHARVGHGADCVVVMIETPDYQAAGHFIVLTPDEAHAFGTRLQQQAKASRRPEAEVRAKKADDLLKGL